MKYLLNGCVGFAVTIFLFSSAYAVYDPGNSMLLCNTLEVADSEDQSITLSCTRQHMDDLPSSSIVSIPSKGDVIAEWQQKNAIQQTVRAGTVTVVLLGIIGLMLVYLCLVIGTWKRQAKGEVK